MHALCRLLPYIQILPDFNDNQFFHTCTYTGSTHQAHDTVRRIDATQCHDDSVPTCYSCIHQTTVYHTPLVINAIKWTRARPPQSHYPDQLGLHQLGGTRPALFPSGGSGPPLSLEDLFAERDQASCALTPEEPQLAAPSQ